MPKLLNEKLLATIMDDLNEILDWGKGDSPYNKLDDFESGIKVGYEECKVVARSIKDKLEGK